MNYAELYNKIETLRKAKGLSINKLSYEAGISHNTLFNWKEHGYTPSLPVLEGVCDALGISLGELFADDNQNECSESEKRMLNLFSCLNNEQKRAVLSLLESMAQNKK